MRTTSRRVSSRRSSSAISTVNLSSLLIIPSILSSILLALPSAHAYIPAVPINDTARLNLTDASTIGITWNQPVPGVFSGQVSYQLMADIPTNGTTKGALVHFTEGSMGPNATTSTPWIAYISCDVNETGASMEWDIFTLARDRGAVSALLYSTTSQSCLLTSEYITDFEKPLDVFATGTVQVARVIERQFVHTNATFYTYNGTLLNETGSIVNASLANIHINDTAYLSGTLTARNSTGQAIPTDIPGPTQTPVATQRSGPSQGLIALYVILGVVCLMFILMLSMAARRALLHPERYGRREGNETEAPQTRAAGIAQALLDTFPIIKFSSGQPHHHRKGDLNSPKHLPSESELGHQDQTRASPNTLVRESQSRSRAVSGVYASFLREQERERESIAMRSMQTEETGSQSFHSALEGDDISVKSVEASGSGSGSGSRHQSHYSLPSASTPASRSGSRRTSRHETPHLLGGARASTAEMTGDMEEQCPICLLDFEEGDDLRILPCEKEHVYHRNCIDPWLLNESSSCPLCRKDFNAPTGDDAPLASPSSSPPTSSGFARYLAFMRRPRAGTGDRSWSGDDHA